MMPTNLRRTGALLVSAALLASLTVATVAAPASAAKPKCAGKTATIVGTNKGEVIKGTKKADVIVAKGGHDTIYGLGGNDTICGGPGHDKVVGAAGNDLLFGQTGRDKLFGGAGRDRLLGGPANDRLAGGPGNDACLQGAGIGERLGCERPALAPVPVPVPVAPPAPPPTPTPAPTPTTGKLVVGGTGSGQVGGGFQRIVSDGRLLAWEASSSCKTGRAAIGGPEYEYYRFAMEFPLSGLPAGASVTKATLAIVNTTAPATDQAIRGYAGNGTLEVADIEVDETPVALATSTSSYTTVDVKSLLTPAVLSSDWAGFALRHGAATDVEFWDCLRSDADYPILTVEYKVP